MKSRVVFLILASLFLSRPARAHSPRAPEPRLPIARSDDHFYVTVYYSKQVISYDINSAAESISTAPFFVSGLAYADDSLYATGDGQIAIEKRGRWETLETGGAVRSIASDGKSLWAISDKELFEIRGEKVVRKVQVHGLRNKIFALFASHDGLYVSCLEIIDEHYGDAEGAGFFKLNPDSGEAEEIRLPKGWRDDVVYGFIPTSQKGIYQLPFWRVWSVSGNWLFDAMSESFTATHLVYLGFDEILAGSKNPSRDLAAYFHFAKTLRPLGLYLGQSEGLNPGEAGEFWEMAYRVDFDYFRKSFLGSLNEPFSAMDTTFRLHQDDGRLRELILRAAKFRPANAIQLPFLLGMRPGKETEEALVALFIDKNVGTQLRWDALEELKKVSASRAESLCATVMLSSAPANWEQATAKRECGK